MRKELGVQKNFRVRAKLYKILLCEKGESFRIHRDSEKEDGMFGTLAVDLPTAYKGGFLLVNIKRKKRPFFTIGFPVTKPNMLHLQRLSA